MKLVLIGDIHLYSFQLRPRQWLSKRLLGVSNLYLFRRKKFAHDRLHEIFEQAAALKPDLVLCSGDLTSTSTEVEFRDVMTYFEPLVASVPVIMVPGNHDRYTFRSARTRRMEHILSRMMPVAFPHHQRLTDKWHLLALDSAIPQLVLSRGALGAGQLQAVGAFLKERTRDEGVVILCHYPVASPPGVASSWTHNLKEDRALREMLEACPARIIFIHGHIHQPWIWHMDGHQGRPRLTCVNAGAPVMISSRYPCGQGFWEIDLPAEVDGDVPMTRHLPSMAVSKVDDTPWQA